MAQVKTLQGTVLKLALNFSFPASESVTLDTIDFYTEWYCDKGRVLRLDKGALVRVLEEDVPVWYAFIDTGVVGKGYLRMRLHASIPDDDAPNGIRTEYAEIDTGIIIA